MVNINQPSPVSDDAPTMLPPLLQTYPSQQQRHDELMQPTGTPRTHWQALIETLEALSPEQVHQRVEAIAHQVRENGVTYNVYADTKGLQRPWGLDILPFILPQEEWQTIESAVTQRATLMNAILNDIYGPQQLMRDGLLPPALVHGHAGFLRPCHGIRLPDDYALHLYAVDMARSPDGQWWVVGDRTQAPSGAGYALENRMIISSAFPELFRDLNVQRLGGFFSSMRDSLAYWGRQVAATQSSNYPQVSPLDEGEHPLIVLLTPGPYNETYHEQSYLAGYLGFPLVQGSDLTVRHGIVWMKTLSGLRPVHAILRRLDDDFCDPLELNPDSLLGIPGLTDAARRGNVLIANSLGSNLLQTGALLGFLPNLCQHLLGQPLLMPSVATWWCGEPAALETVIANMEKLVIKPAFPQIREVPIFGEDLSPDQRIELAQKLRNNPQHYVAQEQVEISQAPVWNDQQPALNALAIGLRVYACATPQGYVVMPGGLTRVGSTQDERVLSMQRGGTSKDTWIVSPGHNDYRSLLRKPTSSRDLIHSNVHLSSRMVENLFWFGRYSVRNHHYTRLLRTAIHRLLEFSSDHRSAEWPTIQALCTWYGLMALEKTADTQEALPSTLDDESIEALLIAGIFSTTQGQPSLANHMQQFFTLAFNLRERLSGDNWRSINQMVKRFNGTPSQSPTLADAILLLDETSTSLVTLAGFSLDGMTRDQGWRFLSIGRRIERLQLLCTLLRNALLMPPESNLEWLLELCDSIVTYRSRYVAQAEWLPALDLLLLDKNNPNSMTFQLKGLIKYLSQISANYGGGGEGPFIEQLAKLRALDPDTQLAPGNPELLAWLNDTFNTSVILSDALNHRFFSYSGTCQEQLQNNNAQQAPLHF